MILCEAAMRQLTCVVKENAVGTPFLALEPGGIYLSFGHWVSIDEAHEVASRLREVFATGALASCSRLDRNGPWPTDVGYAG